MCSATLLYLFPSLARCDVEAVAEVEAARSSSHHLLLFLRLNKFACGIKSRRRAPAAALNNQSSTTTTTTVYSPLYI
jgi:hypothetical protein